MNRMMTEWEHAVQPEARRSGAKPRFVSRIKKEISALKRKKVTMFVQGRTYTV